MAVAVSRVSIVAKSDKSKSGKFHYAGFASSKDFKLGVLEKEVTLLDFWTEKDIEVEYGTILFAEVDVMGDSIVVRDLFTKEEYLAQQ